MMSKIAFMLALFLVALPLCTPRAEAQESTIQRIAQPIADIGDLVINIAERLFAMPMDLAGYITGAVIGFSDAFSANMLTRTAMALVMSGLVLILNITFFFLILIPTLLIEGLLVVLIIFFAFLTAFFVMFGALCTPLYFFFPLTLLLLVFAFFVLLFGAITFLLIAVAMAFPSVILLGFVFLPLFLIPFAYESLGFRELFRMLSPTIAGIVNRLNGLASHFTILALLWSEFYDGLLRGSSISPYVRNYFQILARGFYLEKTPFV
jgi:hypothetical protein